MDACVRKNSQVCPKPPVENWDHPDWGHCRMVWTWDELYEGYKNRSITWYHGSLDRRKRTGLFETYVCVKDDPCSTDLTDTFFCYVWSILEEKFLPWGPNTVLKLLVLPITQDETLHLRADVAQFKTQIHDLQATVQLLTSAVRD
jgi:hypothetical protein